MAGDNNELSRLEELRESGDYETLGKEIDLVDWRSLPLDKDEGIRTRLIAAEIMGRHGDLDEMESALTPLIDNMKSMPFGVAPRVLLVISNLHNRRFDATEALRLALMAKIIARAQGDEFIAAEAILSEGQALWSLHKWREAIERADEAIALFAAQSRSYRLGLGYLFLGGVQGKIGKVEESRTSLERAIRIMLKFRDDHSLATARVDVALSLNAVGEYETALKYLQFAHDSFDQKNLEVHKLTTIARLAESLILLKEHDRASAYLAKATDISFKIRSIDVALIYELKGRLHLARNEWEKSEQSLRGALELADQSGNRAQLAEIRRTLGKLYLAEDREGEAAAILRLALDTAIEMNAHLLELEIKALLSIAVSSTAPVEAADLISEVEGEIADRPLPELKKLAQSARKLIDSLDHEHYFIISDHKMPTLSEARVAMLKWLWARALYKAKGNARDAAHALDVTPTYIRKLTKLIPRDLIRPGRKKHKKRVVKAEV